MTSARERQQRRRQQRESMVRRAGPHEPQIRSASEKPRREIKIPGGRFWFLVPLGVVVLFGVIAVLGSIKPPEQVVPANGIWLDASWTHVERPDAELIAYSDALRRSEIGHIFAFVSSLKADATWAGLPDERNRFSDVEPLVRAFPARLRQVYPGARIYGWIEVRASTPVGYRLDSPQVQRVVAEFAARVVRLYGYDGVFLDVKPVFDGNEDYLALLRAVRANLGLEVPIAVSAAPDYTPEGTALNLPAQIAPGTYWAREYKQRVALQADKVVVMAYNSYIADPIDYLEWVAFQVESFSEAMLGMDSGSRLMISLPNYANNPPAHFSAAESLAGGLDGVARGRNRLSAAQAAMLGGIAIYSDRDLTSSDFDLVRSKWLESAPVEAGG